jgi:hypothetical protein
MIPWSSKFKLGWPKMEKNMSHLADHYIKLGNLKYSRNSIFLNPNLTPQIEFIL